MSRKSILKHSAVLVVLTLFSRVLGLVREAVKAYFLGTTSFSDAFTIAFLIPNLLRRLFAEGSMAAAFVPTLKGYLSENDKAKTKEFLSAFFTFSSFIFTLTVIFSVIFSREIVQLFYSELEGSMLAETALLTKIMFPYLAFISIAALFQGMLNSVNVFGPSGFVPILFNISVISSVFIFGGVAGNPARAMALGVLIGGLFQALYQLPYVLKAGYQFGFISLKSAFTHKGTKKVLRLIAPTVIGMGAYQVNVLISSIIATKAGEGVVSSLSYSNRLLELVLGIFAVSLGTVILSELSSNAKALEWKKFNSNITFAMNLTSLLTIPVTFFTLINAREIVSLIFELNAFDEKSVAVTGSLLMFHISGLFFIAVNRVAAPAFYAQEDTKSPTIAGVVSVFVNLILAYVLVGVMKGDGVALAATISAITNSALIFFFFSRKKSIEMEKILKSFLYSFKLLIFSLIPAAVLYLIKEPVYGFFSSYSFKLLTKGAPLFVSAFIYFLLLFILLILLKDTQVEAVIQIMKKRVKR